MMKKNRNKAAFWKIWSLYAIIGLVAVLCAGCGIAVVVLDESKFGTSRNNPTESVKVASSTSCCSCGCHNSCGEGRISFNREELRLFRDTVLEVARDRPQYLDSIVDWMFIPRSGWKAE